MKVKAKVSFAGEISMFPGEVCDIPSDVAAPLLECGYLAALEEDAAAGDPTVGYLDVHDLKKMKRADLDALAVDMGIEDPSAYKTIADLANAVASIEVTAESED